jgi:hypothetical protein
MSSNSSPSRVGVQTMLLLAAIFGSGVLAGMAVERFIADRPEGRVLLKTPPLEDGIPLQLKRLGLTPGQERQIRAVAGRWQPRADSVMKVLLPEVRGIQHGMFQEMVCILTPAQDSAYLAWRQREGLNQAEGEEQMTRVREGSCPREGESAN